MTETTDTTSGLSPLMRSLSDQLSALVQHAGHHAYEDGKVDGKADIAPERENAPECLVEHMAELLNAFYALAGPTHANAQIVLPRDLPDGFADQMTAFVRDQVAKMEGRS